MIAAGSPEAPAPTMTTSAVRSHRTRFWGAVSASCAHTPARAVAPTPIAAPSFMNFLRLTLNSFCFLPMVCFSLTKEGWNVFGPKASAGLRVGGFTRVRFHIDVVGREQRPVTGNHTNSVVTWYVETDLCFSCERFSVNRGSHFRIEFNVARTSIQDPSHPYTFHGSSDVAISGAVSLTRFRNSVISGRKG